MAISKTAVIVLALLVVTGIANSKDKHAPLPSQVLTAKKVYIDNQSGFAQVMDRAYDELTKWGRFKIVQNPQDADLLLRFSAETTPGQSGSVSTYDYKTNAWQHGTVTTGGDTTVHFAVVDPKTSSILWSATKGKPFHSQTREDIKELKNRIEEQEKPN